MLHRRLAGTELTAPGHHSGRRRSGSASLEAARDGVYIAGQRDGIAQLLFLPGGRGLAQPFASPRRVTFPIACRQRWSLRRLRPQWLDKGDDLLPCHCRSGRASGPAVRQSGAALPS